MIGDVANATTPLLLQELLKWSQRYEVAKGTGRNYPSVGQGVGYALGLLGLLTFGSVAIHHFFVRGMAVGVMSRAAIISTVYNRSLRLSQKSRGEIPNGKIVNHISTDTSRIDFASGFAHMVYVLCMLGIHF